MVTDHVADLIHECQDDVYRQMLRVCNGSREDAEDALSEAILNAVKALDHLRNEDSFRAWLTTIATRACLRQKVRARVYSEARLYGLDDRLLVDRDHLSPEEEAEAHEFAEHVHQVVDMLPLSYRIVYQAVELDDEDVAVMAERLGLTREGVKSRLRRARIMVRDLMDPFCPGCDADHLSKETRDLLAEGQLS